MSDIDTIRQRDADSAETWFKEPPLGACGRAFIDRRWLLAEVDRQRGTLSLAEEGLANYAQENGRLKALADAAIAYVKCWKEKGHAGLDEWTDLFNAVERSREPQSPVT